MASTYSDLKIELIGTGEQTGTWGSTTNTNLGTALEEAITGSADVSFSSSDVTLTLTNTNGTQTARNLRLVCTGTSGGARNLILGSGCQIEKLYLIQNDLADTVTVKNTTGTGVDVPAGARTFVFNDGTNVIPATNASGFSGTLPVANGGTGATSASGARTNLGLGTISTQNSNGVSITGGSITGITDLAVADGGTGASTAANARTNLGLGSLATLNTINNGNWSGTDLAVANGGTGASDVGTARTNLGLGSMATQNSSSVAITGGTIQQLSVLTCYGGGAQATNTALGLYALDDTTSSGQGNTAIGYAALTSNTSGSFNTAVGKDALLSKTTSNANTAVGYQSLYRVNTGYNNTALGVFSGDNITTGILNTCVGYIAGSTLSTGNYNTIVGASTYTWDSTSTRQIVVGYGIIAATSSQHLITMGTPSGKIYNRCDLNATWTQTSDERLKKNIKDDSLGLSFINRLRPVIYQWKASNEIDSSLPYYNETNERDTETVMHGLVAQEVKAALDAEGVDTFSGWDKDGHNIQVISREMFITPLINAIKELSEKCDSLQAEIDKLKGG